MTFSLQFLGVLILLLPGFATLLASQSNDRIRLRRALPGNGSLFVITIVPLFALLVHGFWAFIFFLQALYCSNARCITTDFHPNPYKLVFSSDPSSSVSDGSITYLISMIIVIMLSGPVLARIISLASQDFSFGFLSLFGISPAGEGDERKPDEDWLTYLMRISQPDNRYLVSYILTKRSNDAYDIGYSGVVERINLDSESEIQSITIDECYPFRLVLTDDGFERIPEERETPIRFLTFRRDEIQNMSFEVQLNEDEDFDDKPMLDEGFTEDGD